MVTIHSSNTLLFPTYGKCLFSSPTQPTTQLTDPIDLLASGTRHLPGDQFQQAKPLLTQFRDVFSVSNDKIGQTDISEFDIEDTTPICIPLCWVPLHQQEIVKGLLSHYKQHGLIIEQIDSPCRVATVLVKKKNVSESAHLTDQYHLVVDYCFLNNAIKDTG